MSRFRMRGSSGKVNLALDELPEFACLPGHGHHLRGDITIAPGIDYLERAFDDAKYGDFSRRPFLDIVIPSLNDPSVAPPGKHVMSIFVQYAPYHLKDGPEQWPGRREAFGDTVIATLAEYMPGIEDRILHRQILTPWDLEQTYGLTEGNIFHGELSLEQLSFFRPMAGWARYRTPIRNLWMCASGTHPGGGIMGAPGALCAQRLLRERVLMSGRIVVVGAGHNGLVAALRLAAAGRRVLLLERRDRVGGLSGEFEFHPGYRVPGLLPDLGWVSPRLLTRLGLNSSLLETSAASLLLAEEGGPGLVLGPGSKQPELASRDSRDAEAYVKWQRFIARVRPALDRILNSLPPPLRADSLRKFSQLGEQWWSLRRLGRHRLLELMRVLPMSVSDWLGDWFSSPLLQEGLGGGLRFVCKSRFPRRNPNTSLSSREALPRSSARSAVHRRQSLFGQSRSGAILAGGDAFPKRSGSGDGFRSDSKRESRFDLDTEVSRSRLPPRSESQAKLSGPVVIANPISRRLFRKSDKPKRPKRYSPAVTPGLHRAHCVVHPLQRPSTRSLTCWSDSCGADS